jgi:serine/threonine-protein kinase HipA
VLGLHSGSMSFAYDAAAQRVLSMSMPLRTEPYKSRACEAFFGGLLPEDPDAKKIIGTLFGINSNSNFSLLEKIGFDCAGAVSVYEEGEPILDEKEKLLSGTTIEPHALHELLRDLPERPLLAGIEGMRISLAGAQEKAALCMIENELCIPDPGVPTTHIIKPRIRALRETVVNEYFCMRLAKVSGINAPHVELRRAGDIEYLLIERYDRVFLPDSHLRRIHQEDFCQALGILSTKKYQADGGPSLPDCFNLLDRVTFPVIDKQELLKRVVFNFVIGNADCHGKNFSVLHNDDKTIKLAPAYDLMCTAVYAKVTPRFAMAIGGESEINSVRREHWQRFCKQIAINPTALKRAFEGLSKAITKSLPSLAEEVQSEFANEIAALIHGRIEMLAVSLQGL